MQTSTPWARFRALPRWLQIAAVVALVWAIVTTSSALVDGGSAQVASGPSSTATVRDTTSSTEARTTTTERRVSPEGGHRTGEVEVAATGSEDAVVRTPRANALLGVLARLSVKPEQPRTGYDRGLFPHWDDDDGDGCDTRCEVLSSQRRSDGSWFSEWDGDTTSEPSDLHVDHVVALAEAWDSGAASWTARKRDVFADDTRNLLAVTAASNMRKSDKDAAGWFPSRADANCLWASSVVRVKSEWHLSVDAAERDALRNLLRTCADYRPPTTTTSATTIATTTTVFVPPPPTTAPTSGCTPGYSPCIPPGGDVDCAGGSGNGPRYVSGPVQVDHAHGDPYDLDRDGDGVGCED